MMISCVVLLIAPTGAGDDDGGKKLIIGLPYYKSGFAQFVDVQIDPTNNNNQVVQASGYSIAVFNATIAYLTRLHHGISFEFRAFVNNNGSSAGYYDALVSQISAEKYDAVVGDVTILENRFNHADFTLPYTQSNVKMLVKIRHDPRLNMWILYDRLIGEKIQWGFLLWLPVVQAVFPERESLAKNCSRFVLVMWLILWLIVRDLLVDNLMINSSRVKNYSSIKDYKEALDKGSHNGGVDAIFDEAPYFKAFLKQYGSNYAVVSTKHHAAGFGFAFRKGSNLTSHFSKAILNIRESNEMDGIEERYFGSSDDDGNKDQSNSSSNASPQSYCL
ncbi:glutamate receptor 2.8-like [Neltuma alba]|uniref:glutamate receptor 2.8-like n=1 Tax=Neltuma alba TaxID=207710 RepID=UPI0010A486E8|nr:glutamate receptor 2.8-like [Prosopis alba]